MSLQFWKSTYFYLLALAFLLMFSGLTRGQSITGDGSQGDPFTYYTAANLDSMRYLDDPGVGYYSHQLANDIDMSSYTNWIPIGTWADVWSGAVDGQGFTIQNLTIDTTYTTGRVMVGFFGVLGAGDAGQSDDGVKAVRNLKFDNANINVEGVPNNAVNIGVLAGLSAGNIGNTDVEIDSVTITNSIITVDLNYTPGANNFAIGGMSGSCYRFGHAYVDVDITVLCTGANTTALDEDGLGGITGASGQGFRESAFVGRLFSNVAGLVVGGLCGEDYNSIFPNDSIADCYVNSTYIVSTKYYVGGLAGWNYATSQSKFARCYATVDTLFSTLSNPNDLDGILIGYVDATPANSWYSCYADTQRTAWHPEQDSTGHEVTLKSWVETTTNGQDTAKTTAEMKTQSTFVGWDFGEIGVNVWGIDASTNDGYPYLLWQGVPSSIDLYYPNGSNLVFHADSIINIVWINDIQAGEDSFALFYSSDNGSNWVFIDTTSNSDTSYAWTVPDGIITDAALVLVRTFDSSFADYSDTAFTIIASPGSTTDIEILSVTPQPMLPGGNLDLYVRSTYLDTFQLDWSYDSLTWNYITKVTIDTVNGSYLDTTLYTWTNPGTIGQFYIRALEIRNNFLYYDQDTIEHAGTRVVAGFCYNIETGAGIHELLAIWDPSCGWNSNITQRYYRVNLRENTSGEPSYSAMVAYCEACCRQETCPCDPCDFPDEYLFEIHDTLTDSRARFTEGGVETSSSSGTITYKNRSYSLSKSGSSYRIMVTDLLNNLTQVLVDYTSAVNTGGFGSTKLSNAIGDHRLATYNRLMGAWILYADSSYMDADNQVYVLKHNSLAYDDNLRSRMIAELGVNFGDYDLGYILVGDVDAYYNTYFASSLPAPQYTIPVSEDVVLVQGTTSRNYFRGIVPEAILEMISGK